MLRRAPIRIAAFFLLLWVGPASAQSAKPQNNLLPKTQLLPTSTELAEKCAKAIGGREAWAKLSTLVLTGTIEMPALHLTGQVELYEKAPNRSLRVISVAGKQYVQKHGFDGQIGWELDPKNGLRQLQGPALEQAKLEAVFDSDVHLKEIYPDMKVLGETKLGDKDAYIALARTRPSAKATKMYFDAQSGLHVADETEVLASNGKIEKTITYYEEFRTVGGVQIPFRIRFTSPSVSFAINLANARPNEPLDDSVFAMPDGRQAPLGGAAKDLAEIPDEGDINGNLYKNNFFGLEYQFPQGWTPHGEKTKKQIMEVGKDALSANNTVERGAYEAAEKRTIVLLSVFQYPLGTPVDHNNAIQLMSEDVGFAPGIKTGSDYLLLMENNLKKSALPMEMQGVPVKLDVAGQTFYRQDIVLTVRGKPVYEAMAVTIIKQHALVFVFVAGTTDSRNDLAKTLETTRFDQHVQ